MSARFMAVASFGVAALGLTVACVPASEAAHAAVDPSAAAAPVASKADAGADDAAVRTAGLDLFSSWGCSACHTLADAGPGGDVGPPLDGNAGITKDYVIKMVSNGQGAMPGFGGQMTEDEIATLATYISKFSKK